MAFPPPASDRSAPRWLYGLMEAVVLAMVCLSPWAFGAVHPYFEFYLFAGVALLLLLWGLRMLLERQWTWAPCPVALCLAALWLASLAQLLPWPRSVLEFVSPATVRLQDELLPAEPEMLGSGESASIQSAAVLSLHPAGTRAEALRLLAVLLLFVVVRNNLASQSALRRLSVVALANGALLALFGLVQLFTSPPGLIYWTWPTEGQLFGPFICRTHFAFYINICIGLGLGLLLSAQAAGRVFETRGSNLRDPRTVVAALLQRPQTLWIIAALALLVSADFLSMSRGGVLALLAAGAICFLIQLVLERRLSQLVSVGLLGLLVAGLLSWFGLARLEARLATLWGGKALEEGRLESWSYVFPLAGQFPLAGTGLGTYALVEPLQRPPGEEPSVGWDHAHNDYLEALVEGGIIRLALSLLTIALVYRLGIRALRRHTGHRAAGLAMGALFGFTTVVIHSGGDFGLHIPAIAVLITVVCAQLCALATTERPAGLEDSTRGLEMRFGGIAPIVGATACVLVAIILYAEARRMERAERYRLAAGRAEDASNQLALLAAAVRSAPENAALHLAYAEALFEQARDPDAADATSRRELAVRHYLAARDRCPLLPMPHLRLAANVPHLAGADPREAYLRRAQRLRPSDPEIWYISGLLELQEGRTEQAWPCWRQSLECSDRYFDDIVRQAGAVLDAKGLAERVMPERLALLYRTAALRAKQQGWEAQQPLLEKARQVMEAEPAPPTANDQYLRAQVYRQLGQPAKASFAYRAALAREPQQAGWRLEWAQLLHRQGKLEEARVQLGTLLAQQPGNAEARKLLETIIREEVQPRE